MKNLNITLTKEEIELLEQVIDNVVDEMDMDELDSINILRGILNKFKGE